MIGKILKWFKKPKEVTTYGGSARSGYASKSVRPVYPTEMLDAFPDNQREIVNNEREWSDVIPKDK